MIKNSSTWKYIRLLKRDNDHLYLERTTRPQGCFYYKKWYYVTDYKKAINDLKLWLDNKYIFLGVDYEDNDKLYDSDYINICANEFNSIYKDVCNSKSKEYIKYLIDNWNLIYNQRNKKSE